MSVLTTERLEIRALTTGDAAFIHALLNDPDWVRFIGPRDAATVEAANYFNGNVLDLQKGDTIQATMAKGGTPVMKHYVVTANTGTVVTIVIANPAVG